MQLKNIFLTYIDKCLCKFLFVFYKDDTKYDGSSTTESDQGRGNSEAGSFIGSPAVDPLIVKFEEGMRLY